MSSAGRESAEDSSAMAGCFRPVANENRDVRGNVKIMLVQNAFPHYRVPVWQRLAAHPGIDLTLVHSTNPWGGPSEIAQTNVIEAMPFRVLRGEISAYRFLGKPILWHKPAVDLLENESFDVVIHIFETRWASLWKMRSIQRKRGKKLILWGIGGSLKRTPVLDVLRRYIVRQVDAVVFYTDANRQRFVQMGVDPRKLFVARNSIDIGPIDSAIGQWPQARLAAFRREKRLNEGPVLLSVGRLMARKRLDLLIRAAARLSSQWPPLRLVIVGDGPERNQLHKLARDLGIEDRVILPGAIVDESMVAPWFLSSDLVVAPAQVGLLITHAHAYGRPVVTCDNPALQGPEIEVLVPDQTGVVYPYDDLNALVETIANLLKDDHRRLAMGSAARLRVTANFGVEQMVNGFVEAISFVTGGTVALDDGVGRSRETDRSGSMPKAGQS